jgi:hypothetical protein
MGDNNFNNLLLIITNFHFQMNFQKIASFCSTLDQFGVTYIPAIKKD